MNSLICILTMNNDQLLRTFATCSDHTITGKDFVFIPAEDKTAGDVCFVAHVDTVFDYMARLDTISDRVSDGSLYAPPKNIYPGGLGADDRVGCYVLYRLLTDIKVRNFSVLITDKEEVGAIGAIDATNCLGKELFDNCIAFVEVDRKGVCEMVFYDDYNHDFYSFMMSLGYSIRQGSFSDITILTDYYKIQSVNISCGYNNPHTTQEYIIKDEIIYCINSCKYIITNITKSVENKRLSPIEKFTNYGEFWNE